ncbi:MAG: D-alanyl-D-alanine carboxypeptidase/D-alanyl-D-alanine-endopeptidase [Pseudomonadota bacterium]
MSHRHSMFLIVILLLFATVAPARADDPRATGELPPLPMDDDPLKDGKPEEVEPPPSGQSDATGVDPGQTAAPEEPEEPDWVWSPDPKLAAAMDDLLGRQDLVGATVGVYAVEYPSGRLIYQRAQDDALMPASSIKILTAAAFLEAFGGDHRFVTRILTDGTSLWLVGGGDPGLDAKDLKTLAQKAGESGLTEVKQVFVDASLFDDQDLPPHYDTKNTDAWYRSSVGAAAVEDGGMVVKVTPGNRIGGGVLVEVSPPTDYFIVDNTAVTTEDDRGDLEVRVRESRGRAGVYVRGSLSSGSMGEAVKRRVPSPNLLAGWLMVRELKAAGVHVKERVPELRAAPQDAQAVCSVQSNRVRSDVIRMVKTSNNFVAEQLTKNLGADCSPRTWDCSLTRLRALVRRIGLRTETFRLENGSGLYDANRLSPRQLVRFYLEASNRSSIAPIIDEAFAVAGGAGTLYRRLREVKGRVRGKTGTLDGVACIAGRADLAHGRQLWFAILINDAKAPASTLRKLQDQMILAMMGEWRPRKAKK